MNPRLMMLMIGAALVSACAEPDSLDGRCEALFGKDARAPTDKPDKRVSGKAS